MYQTPLRDPPRWDAAPYVITALAGLSLIVGGTDALDRRSHISCSADVCDALPITWLTMVLIGLSLITLIATVMTWRRLSWWVRGLGILLPLVGCAFSGWVWGWLFGWIYDVLYR